LSDFKAIFVDWDIDWYLGLDEYSSDISDDETPRSEASFVSAALD